MKLKNKIVFSILTLITLFFIGCPGKHRSEQEVLRSDIDSLRKVARLFLIESNNMYFNIWVFGKELNIKKLYKNYGNLFNINNIDAFNRSLKLEQRKERVDKISRLKTFVYNEIVNSKSINLLEKVENLKTFGNVDIDGNSFSFYSLRGKIANEPKQKTRERYYIAWSKFLENINPTALKRVEKNIEQIDSMKFENGYIQFSEMIRELNFTKFTELINGYLESTNETYNNLLQEMLRNNKLSAENFYRYDTYRMLKNDKYDKYFKKDSLLSVWKSSFANLGFIIDSLKNLYVNVENIPNKNPRAVCFGVDIPVDIRMSIKPIGGFEDYSALFHETGHGLHFALTKEKDFEFQYLNNNTITETYSFLFEHLLDEPLFIKKHFNIKDNELKSLIKFRAFHRLYMTRRYCAKFLYEMQLYDSLAQAPKKYAEILSSVLGYKATEYDENFYLDDVDDFFYVVDYLRAWFIEAMLKTELKESYGEDWFNNPSAGSYLTSFFETGNRYTVDEFVRQVGFNDIDPKFLYNDIESLLEYSKSK